MPLEKNAFNRLALALLGLFVGVFEYALVQTMVEQESNSDAPFLRLVLMAFVGLFSAYLVFTWNRTNLPRLFGSVLAIVLAFIIPLWWVLSYATPDEAVGADLSRLAVWSVFTAIAWFILLPFLGIYKESGQLRFPYEKLFEYSWNNLFIALIASFVSGIIWLLLSVLAGLFSVLSVSYFRELFFTGKFFWTMTPAMFTFGVALARENDTIIRAMRRITLTIFLALFPVLIAVILLFLVALLPLGIDTLLDTHFASLLLFLVACLSHLFLNSVLQDGQGERPYPAWLLRIVNGFLVVFPVICVLSTYALSLRIGQHGLTVQRFLAAIGQGIALFYALGYAYAAVMDLAGKNEGWLDFVPKVNTFMAIAIPLLFILVCSPVLDPAAWSARSQYNRLIEGVVEPDDFDLEHLESLGHVSEKILDRIAATTDPRFASIRTAIAEGDAEPTEVEADAPEDEEASVDERPLVLSDLEIVPPETVLPPGLFDRIKKDLERTTYQVEVPDQEILTLFPVNVDADPEDEYFLVYEETVSRLLYYDPRPDGSWPSGQSYFMPSWGQGSPSAKDVRQLVMSGEVKATPPRVRDLQIGSTRFEPFGNL